MKIAPPPPGKLARALTGALVLCFVPVSRLAAQTQEFYENVQHWCQDPWMLTPQGIVDCLQDDYREADAELNRVYQQVMASLTSTRRQALRTSQRAWLVRYDSVLTSYYSKDWAQHRRSKVLPSQIKAVRDRTAYLRRVWGSGGPSSE